jgi:hypothetical protein
MKMSRNICQPVTHATNNLGIWLNEKIGLYLANPKNDADLTPNCL